MQNKENPEESFGDLITIIEKLRSPDGCPWDRKQTPQLLAGSLIEETYECIDAIKEHDTEHQCEELGDLYLLITMISYINQQEGNFTISDSLKSISEKLIRRHPHVFGDSEVTSTEDVLKQWEEIKRDVEGRDSSPHILDEIPRNVPPLERALLIQKKVAKYGFDWKHRDDVFDKLKEEIEELDVELQSGDMDAVEEEMGDLIFSVVNLCRYMKLDPSIIMHRANEKFINRFNSVEDSMHEKGLSMDKDNLDEMENSWQEIKKS